MLETLMYTFRTQQKKAWIALCVSVCAHVYHEENAGKQHNMVQASQNIWSYLHSSTITGSIELYSGDAVFARDMWGSGDPMDDVIQCWVTGG